MPELKQAVNSPINIAYPIQYASKGAFATNNTTIDAIADDLKVLLKTNWGERPIYYNFGANLRSLVFRHTTDIQQKATDLITSAVNNWMSFVTVKNVNVVLSNDDATLTDNQARIEVDFSLGDTGLGGTVTVDIK